MDLRHQPPALHDYLRLRAESGLTPRSPEESDAALRNSWAWVHVVWDECTVAMGRVIGDGGWYFHIADIATLPAYQRRGIGRAVLHALLDRIYAQAPGQPWITLFADAPGVPLYTSMGFVPNGCQGMELPARPAR
jgi:GNAT superfamily N-acetyltransferase